MALTPNLHGIGAGDTARPELSAVGLAEQRRFPPKIVGHAYPQMQPGCPRGKGVSCPMLYFRRNVRAKAKGGGCDRRQTRADAARMAGQFLYAKFHGFRGI